MLSMANVDVPLRQSAQRYKLEFVREASLRILISQNAFLCITGPPPARQRCGPCWTSLTSWDRQSLLLRRLSNVKSECMPLQLLLLKLLLLCLVQDHPILFQRPQPSFLLLQLLRLLSLPLLLLRLYGQVTELLCSTRQEGARRTLVSVSSEKIDRKL